MLVGIDDTDSKEGMCTTYLAAKIIKDLHLCWRVSNWYEGVVVISVGVNEQEIDKLETT